MPFLFDKIDTLKEVGYYSELPQYIKENLNPDFELRPYQVAAFCNYITYFENPKYDKNQHKRCSIWQQEVAKHSL